MISHCKPERLKKQAAKAGTRDCYYDVSPHGMNEEMLKVQNLVGSFPDYLVIHSERSVITAQEMTHFLFVK